MTTVDPPIETEVDERGALRLPTELRDRLDADAGDRLRWSVDEDRNVEIKVVEEYYGAFDGDDLSAPMGGDGQETHDLAGHENDPAFPEDTD